LTKTGLSDNAGGVKHVSTTLLHAPVEERHFALIGEVLSPNQGSLLIRIQVGNSVRPMHLFGDKLDLLGLGADIVMESISLKTPPATTRAM